MRHWPGLFLASCCWMLLTNAFHHHVQFRRPTTPLYNSIAVPASQLEENLSPDEKTVVGMVRKTAPAVGFVTSIMRQARRNRKNKNNHIDKNNLPNGQSLGSGSCFLVDPKGYLVTNYHVIQSAYELNQMATQRNEILPNFRNTSIPCDVYVRINSATKFQKCRVVQVEPALDLALLCLDDLTNDEALPFLSFGPSSDLLVGQDLIAIGNPFGLDNTVTTGVVSALNRPIQASRNRFSTATVIPNGIQTDCAINPGNSGGPLLNRKGEVVGVNTAILTTSGSNAGVGFAVPSDAVEPVVQEMIRHDRSRQTRAPRLGLRLVQRPSNDNNSTSKLLQRHWITTVAPPAEQAGVRPLSIRDVSVVYGDALVAIGNQVVQDMSYRELAKWFLDRCRPGEKLALTVEDGESGERRVVYLTVGSMMDLEQKDVI